MLGKKKFKIWKFSEDIGLVYLYCTGLDLGHERLTEPCLKLLGQTNSELQNLGIWEWSPGMGMACYNPQWSQKQQTVSKCVRF